MALFGSFGNVVSTALNLAGTLGGGSPVGIAGQLGSAFITPLVAGGPVTQVASLPMAGRAQPVNMPVIGAATSAFMRIVAPILIKIALVLGRRSLSLRQAVKIIRKVGGVIKDPATIAATLGITLTELAHVITASAHIKSRRMNPSNVKALRRSMRRLESFHRLCVRADQLRGTRRGGRRSKSACAPGVQVIRGG